MTVKTRVVLVVGVLVAALASAKVVRVQSRIVGGTEAIAGEFPYIVSM